MFVTRSPHVFTPDGTTITESTNITSRGNDSSVMATTSHPSIPDTFHDDSISKTTLATSKSDLATTTASSTTSVTQEETATTSPVVTTTRSTPIVSRPVDVVESSSSQSTAGTDNNRRLCRRRKQRKGKGNRKIGRNGQRKNRRGQKRRKGNSRRRDRKKTDRKQENQDGGRSKNRRKSGRRGCRRRRKNKSTVRGTRGFINTTSVSTTQKVPPPNTRNYLTMTSETEPNLQTIEKAQQPVRNHEIHNFREKINLSLLEEGERGHDNERKRETEEKRQREYGNNRQLRRYPSPKFLYRNRPLEMVKLKQSQTYRKGKPRYVRGHRVRHGNGD